MLDNNIFAGSVSFTGVIILCIMTGILFRRNLKEYRLKKGWNWSRTIIMCGFMVNLVLNLTQGMYYIFNFELTEDWILVKNAFSINLILQALISALGLMLIAYLNQKDSFIFLPLFILTGCVVFYYAVGIWDLILYFFIIGGILGLILLFQIAFQIRDDNTFGLGVFYVLFFLGAATGNRLFTIIALIYGIYYVTGKFTPFKYFEQKKIKSDFNKDLAQKAEV